MKKVIISLAIAAFFLSSCGCNSCCNKKAAEGECAAVEEVCDSTKCCCGECAEGKTCEGCEKAEGCDKCQKAEGCENCQKAE